MENCGGESGWSTCFRPATRMSVCRFNTKRRIARVCAYCSFSPSSDMQGGVILFLLYDLPIPYSGFGFALAWVCCRLSAAAQTGALYKHAHVSAPRFLPSPHSYSYTHADSVQIIVVHAFAGWFVRPSCTLQTKPCVALLATCRVRSVVVEHSGSGTSALISTTGSCWCLRHRAAGPKVRSSCVTGIFVVVDVAG